ncbi:hypothetical protein [Ornithinimicrobium sufpigmenti]|uniref:hypothetical protein n=1 Tax=Ornithinimicrobium sufpigmenti TaxID=2508882 RepID=UPI00103616E9|nr:MULTISPECIES: hypothetical protein [unclassified Ornithinimicrobium]
MSNSSPQTTPAQNPPKRSGVRTVLGWLLIVIAGLALLGNLARLSSLNDGASGTAEMLGAIVGVVLAIAVPLVIGILLLRRPKA